MENTAVIHPLATGTSRTVTLEIETDVGMLLNAIAGLSEAADLFIHERVAADHPEAASGVALANMLLSRSLAESELSA